MNMHTGPETVRTLVAPAERPALPPMGEMPPCDPQPPLVMEGLRQLHAALASGELTTEQAAARVQQLIYLANASVGIKVLREVAQKHGLKPEVIRSDQRFRHVIEARRELCVRLREELEWSYERIGDFLGRNHASIINMVKPKYGKNAA